MKILKKRFFALILAVIIVLGASMVSVHTKLNKEFSQVSDDFYNGVEVNGERDISIHSQLIQIGRVCEDIVAVADRYGIDVGEFKDNVDYFNYDILVMDGNISYIHYLYEELLDDIMEAVTKISSVELSKADEQITVNALENILQAKDNIENSAYNERVRKYISSLPFLMDFFANITGAYLPEYFA